MDQHFAIALIHLILVVPLFLFIGFQRSNTPSWLYLATLAIGIIILLYHGYKLFLRLQTRSSYWWVNAIHVALVAPLLIYIGYFKKETPRFAYELLLMLAFAAAGYHLFSIIKMLDAHPEPKQ